LSIQQAGNKLMQVALNSDLGDDAEYVQAVKTLVDAAKDRDRLVIGIGLAMEGALENGDNYDILADLINDA